MSTETQAPHVYWEKVSIEPDLGDQRQSTYKALPSPPKTPKRVMMKYRFSGVFPLVLSLTAFVLSLIVVLAGQKEGSFEDMYLVALNTSHAGQDIITFKRASTTSTAPAAPAATPSVAPNPLDVLNPFSSNNPLNPANPNNILNGALDAFSDLTGNLTDAVNDGLEDLVNGVVESVVDKAGLEDFYYVYLRKVCSARLAGANESNADGAQVSECRSWEEVDKSLSDASKSIPSSVTVGQTEVSVPLLAKLTSSLNGGLGGLDVLRKAVFAFLIITLIGSILSVISIPPAVFFPQSRLLVYINMFWPALASVFASLAATLLTAVVVVAGVVNGLSETAGVRINQGGTVLLLVWLSAVFVSLVAGYWTSVWFVETRKSSFIRRQRDEDEMGNWKGIGKEVWRDLQGRRRKPNMRTDVYI